MYRLCSDRLFGVEVVWLNDFIRAGRILHVEHACTVGFVVGYWVGGIVVSIFRLVDGRVTVIVGLVVVILALESESSSSLSDDDGASS